MSNVDQRILDEVRGVFTKDIKNFVKSLFVDTRLTQDITVQYYDKPKGFSEAVAVFEKYQGSLGKILRRTFPSKYEYIVEMDKTRDPRERMALWATYIEP